MTSSQTSAGTSSMGTRCARMIPATWTSTSSSPPSQSAASPTADVTADSSLTSTRQWRDDSSSPAGYYGSIKGAPVQSSSYGVQGNVYLSLWF